MRMFENMSDAQLRYLGHVVWRWTRTVSPSRKHTQQLTALPRLRTLVVDAKEEEVDQVRIFSELDWIAGWSSKDVSHLTAIKCLQNVVVFFGPIAGHEQFLRSQMVGRKS